MKLLPVAPISTIFLAMAVTATPFAQEYDREVLVPGYGFSAIHGITFDEEDTLYVGSVIGQSIFQVDPETGESSVYVGPSKGMADDLEFGPNGLLAWTSFSLGTVHARKGDGPIEALARGLLGINSIAFNAEGRLFATQVFLGDALYEIDPNGAEKPRKILENMGGLNGFDFGPDGWLYGPLWFKGQVAKVNVDTGELQVVADGFGIPAAANFDSQGNLYVLDTKMGEIVRVNVETGDKTVLSKFKKGMDNLAFDSRDRLFVTVMTNNAIYEIDTDTGKARTVKKTELSVPSDIAVYNETIYVADLFALRSIDGESGEVTTMAVNYAEHIDLPINISVNEEHILTCSWFAGSVQLLDRETGDNVVLAHGFSSPVDAIEEANGDWLVLEAGSGNLLRATGPEKAQRRTIAEGLRGAAAMAKGPGDSVYATIATDGKVVRIDTTTGEKTDIATDLELPEGIDVARDGRIFVAEVGKRRLLAIDPDSGKSTVIAKDLPVGLSGVFGMPRSYVPTGVAASQAGNIYLTSDLQNAVYKLVPSR